MTPAKYNMIVPQGSTFSKQMTWIIDDTPVNLTGYTARLQVRSQHQSRTLVLQLDSQAYAPLTSALFLGGAGGTIQIYIKDSDTQALSPKSYVYDLELYSNDETYRLIEGQFVVTPEVTV